jgi:hypothetical protein
LGTRGKSPDRLDEPPKLIFRVQVIEALGRGCEAFLFPGLPVTPMQPYDSHPGARYLPHGGDAAGKPLRLVSDDMHESVVSLEAEHLLAVPLIEP